MKGSLAPHEARLEAQEIRRQGSGASQTSRGVGAEQFLHLIRFGPHVYA